MSKYLIGVIPSLFLLLIACFARATPVAQPLESIAEQFPAPALLLSSSTTPLEKETVVK